MVFTAASLSPMLADPFRSPYLRFSQASELSRGDLPGFDGIDRTRRADAARLSPGAQAGHCFHLATFRWHNGTAIDGTPTGRMTRAPSRPAEGRAAAPRPSSCRSTRRDASGCPPRCLHTTAAAARWLEPLRTAATQRASSQIAFGVTDAIPPAIFVVYPLDAAANEVLIANRAAHQPIGFCQRLKKIAWLERRPCPSPNNTAVRRLAVAPGVCCAPPPLWGIRTPLRFQSVGLRVARRLVFLKTEFSVGYARSACSSSSLRCR